MSEQNNNFWNIFLTISAFFMAIFGIILIFFIPWKLIDITSISEKEFTSLSYASGIFLGLALFNISFSLLLSKNNWFRFIFAPVEKKELLSNIFALIFFSLMVTSYILDNSYTILTDPLSINIPSIFFIFLVLLNFYSYIFKKDWEPLINKILIVNLFIFFLWEYFW